MDLQTLLTLLGVLGQFFNQSAQQQQQTATYNAQTGAAANAQNPNYINAMIARLTQPQTRAMQTNTENQVNAALGPAGLATSPGIANYQYAQALAPTNLELQNEAVNLTTQGLQYPFQIGSGLAGRYPQYSLATGGTIP